MSLATDIASQSIPRAKRPRQIRLTKAQIAEKEAQEKLDLERKQFNDERMQEELSFLALAASEETDGKSLPRWLSRSETKDVHPSHPTSPDSDNRQLCNLCREWNEPDPKRRISWNMARIPFEGGYITFHLCDTCEKDPQKRELGALFASMDYADGSPLVLRVKTSWDEFGEKREKLRWLRYSKESSDNVAPEDSVVSRRGPPFYLNQETVTEEVYRAYEREMEAKYAVQRIKAAEELKALEAEGEPNMPPYLPLIRSGGGIGHRAHLETEGDSHFMALYGNFYTKPALAVRFDTDAKGGENLSKWAFVSDLRKSSKELGKEFGPGLPAFRWEFREGLTLKQVLERIPLAWLQMARGEPPGRPRLGFMSRLLGVMQFYRGKFE